jgi:hypothetical protein
LLTNSLVFLYIIINMNRIVRSSVTAFRPRVAQQVARVPTKFAFSVHQPVMQFAVRSFAAAGGMETEGEVCKHDN